MADVLTEVMFWSQVIGDSKRTIVCPPDLESRIKSWIDARDMGALLTVVANPACPADRILVIDQQAHQAYLNQAIQTYRPRFGRPTKQDPAQP